MEQSSFGAREIWKSTTMTTYELTYLPARASNVQSDVESGADDSHPMRIVTKEVAQDLSSWTVNRAHKVTELFDSMAQGWSQRSNLQRIAVVEDALDRGGARSEGYALEIGAGSGVMTQTLHNYFEKLVSVDISPGMLSEVRVPQAELIRCDASELPFADSSFDTLVVVNMFLFALEYKRVLKRDGRILWVSSIGEKTPIYLHPEEVLQALGGEYSGVFSDCGEGRWASLWRA